MNKKKAVLKYHLKHRNDEKTRSWMELNQRDKVLLTFACPLSHMTL